MAWLREMKRNAMFLILQHGRLLYVLLSNRHQATGLWPATEHVSFLFLAMENNHKQSNSFSCFQGSCSMLGR